MENEEHHKHEMKTIKYNISGTGFIATSFVVHAITIFLVDKSSVTLKGFV